MDKLRWVAVAAVAVILFTVVAYALSELTGLMFSRAAGYLIPHALLVAFIGFAIRGIVINRRADPRRGITGYIVIIAVCAFVLCGYHLAQIFM